MFVCYESPLVKESRGLLGETHLNMFLNVVFVVLGRLGRRSPLLEHTIYLEFNPILFSGWPGQPKSAR